MSDPRHRRSRPEPTEPESVTAPARARPRRGADPDWVHRQVAGGSAEAAALQRGDTVFAVRLPGHSIDLTLGELAPTAATRHRRHACESLVYILRGRGHTVLEGTRLDWQAGDAIYIRPWAWHRHVAADDTGVQYLTATNLPLLRAIGLTLLGEERDSRASSEPGGGWTG
jgi:quercetin dioxygenase-like cupin family protein